MDFQLVAIDLKDLWLAVEFHRDKDHYLWIIGDTNDAKEFLSHEAFKELDNTNLVISKGYGTLFGCSDPEVIALMVCKTEHFAHILVNTLNKIVSMQIKEDVVEALKKAKFSSENN